MQYTYKATQIESTFIKYNEYWRCNETSWICLMFKVKACLKACRKACLNCFCLPDTLYANLGLHTMVRFSISTRIWHILLTLIVNFDKLQATELIKWFIKPNHDYCWPLHMKNSHKSHFHSDSFLQFGAIMGMFRKLKGYNRRSLYTE